jgi:Flp pilus assembly protein TadD
MTRSHGTASDDQRIPALIDAANQALANGRTAEAANLVRQAELESPGHPLVLNEIGRRTLLSGNAARAREVFEQALRSDASNL